MKIYLRAIKQVFPIIVYLERGEDEWEEIIIDEYEYKMLHALFALPEPTHLYQVEKKAGLSHATAHKKMKSLQEKGLVEIVAKERTRTGLESSKYTLTRRGLECCIKLFGRDLVRWKKIGEKIIPEITNEDLVKRLARLAVKAPDIHPALEWWDVFMTRSKLLQCFYLDCFDMWDIFPECVFGLLTELDKEDIIEIALHLEDMTYLRSKNISKDLVEELLSLIRENEKLKNFLIQKLEYLKHIYRVFLEDLEAIEKKILSQPPPTS